MADQDVILPEQNPHLAKRFRGYLPIVVDIETGGFDAVNNAILEIAVVTLKMTENGNLQRDQTYFHHIMPHPSTSMTQSSLEFTGIDPYHPFRFAVTEEQGIRELFAIIRKHVKNASCQKAILVGHNAAFDMSFLQAAVARHKMKRNPFHPFSTLDTASLSAVFLGQTVLARAVQAAGLRFHQEQAHSAIYDAEITADLFCRITNQWLNQGGWDVDENKPMSFSNNT